MNPNTLIQFVNCNILRNHKFIKDDIWVRDGKIINPEKIFFDEKKQADTIVDCEGNYLAPGLIDLQINGGFGHDFSYSSNIEQSINVVSKKLLSHGVTSYCPTLVTSPKHVYHQILPKIRKRKGGVDGATILGVHTEGPFINVDKKGAHPPDCIKSYDNGISSLTDMYGSLENIKIITLAPEFPNCGEVIKSLVDKNITVSLGHSTSNLAQGEEAVNNGATLITHLFNAMLPFHHRDPGLVGLLTSTNIPKNKTVYFGIIADGVHTHPAALRIAYRVHPEGLVLVTDAISALGLEEGQHNIGQMAVEIRNCHAFIAGTNTLCGSIASMIESVQFLIKATDCSVEYALEAASYHPAQVLGIENTKGTLQFGADADFIILDKSCNLVSTWIGGECVYKN